MYDKQMITNAGREGARAGIVARYTFDGTESVYDPLTEENIRDKVNTYLGGINSNYLKSLGADAQATTSASWDPSFPTRTGSGAYLTVTVSYPYTFMVLPNFVTTITGTITLAGITVMRME
jgi:hypothetical protein